MRRKILTITFLTTLVFWLGCAGTGEEKNYKVLEEDQPMFDTDPDRTGSMAEPQTEPAVVEIQAVDAGAGETVAVVEEQALAEETTLAAAEPHPLDRSFWDRIPVHPVSGVTHHRTVYYNRYDLTDEKAPAPAIDDQTEAELNAALDGAFDKSWNGTNAANFLIEPAGFGIDTLALPIRAIFTPPWAMTTTP